MDQIRKDYESGHLNGWAESRVPGLIKQNFSVFGEPRTVQPVRKSENKKVFLYKIVREVLGKDTENYSQQIGDCVSFGAKNATEYLTCCQMYLDSSVKFRNIFPPYYYGTGRVYIGGGRLGNSDGSLGSWQAQAVTKFGTLFTDDENVPHYSGSVAKAWGDPRPAGDLDKFKPIAIDNPVKDVSLVKTWDDLVNSICVNLTPVTTASDIGYNMEPSSDNFHRQTTKWAHQMMIMGVDNNDSDPYALILNSWGDVHGHLKDFETGEQLPVGVLRVRRKDVEKHLRQNDSYSYGKFTADQLEKLDKALFKVL